MRCARRRAGAPVGAGRVPCVRACSAASGRGVRGAPAVLHGCSAAACRAGAHERHIRPAKSSVHSACPCLGSRTSLQLSVGAKRQQQPRRRAGGIRHSERTYSSPPRRPAPVQATPRRLPAACSRAGCARPSRVTRPLRPSCTLVPIEDQRYTWACRVALRSRACTRRSSDPSIDCPCPYPTAVCCPAVRAHPRPVMGGPTTVSGPEVWSSKPLGEYRSHGRLVWKQILAEPSRGRGEAQAPRSGRLPACQSGGSGPLEAELREGSSDRRRGPRSSGAVYPVVRPHTALNRRTMTSLNRRPGGG